MNTAVRDALAALYPTRESAVPVVRALFPDLLATVTAGPTDRYAVWNALLTAAEQRKKLLDLVKLTVQAHPQDAPLRAAVEGCLRAPAVVTGQDKVRIALLSANPAGTPLLHLDIELREIELAVQQSTYRDSLELSFTLAVRPADLVQALVEKKPRIVHFSGHGSDQQQLILLDDDDRPAPVGKEALVQLFSALEAHLDEKIRLVFLNACFSRDQAEGIVAHVDCAVGMSKAIGDDAAIVFAKAFYARLGDGQSVKGAFDLALSELGVDNLPGQDTPQLLTRDGVDASLVYFASPAAPLQPTPARVIVIAGPASPTHGDEPPLPF